LQVPEGHSAGAIRAVRTSTPATPTPYRGMVNDAGLILLLLPIILIQLGLMVFALWDLTRPERRVRGDSKLMWGLIVVFVGMLGPIIYLAVGREDG
jgi:hypothetical protein